jgi:hypothetical protein
MASTKTTRKRPRRVTKVVAKSKSKASINPITIVVQGGPGGGGAASSSASSNGGFITRDQGSSYGLIPAQVREHIAPTAAPLQPVNNGITTGSTRSSILTDDGSHKTAYGQSPGSDLPMLTPTPQQRPWPSPRNRPSPLVIGSRGWMNNDPLPSNLPQGEKRKRDQSSQGNVDRKRQRHETQHRLAPQVGGSGDLGTAVFNQIPYINPSKAERQQRIRQVVGPDEVAYPALGQNAAPSSNPFTFGATTLDVNPVPFGGMGSTWNQRDNTITRPTPFEGYPYTRLTTEERRQRTRMATLGDEQRVAFAQQSTVIPDAGPVDIAPIQSGQEVATGGLQTTQGIPAADQGTVPTTSPLDARWPARKVWGGTARGPFVEGGAASSGGSDRWPEVAGWGGTTYRGPFVTPRQPVDTVTATPPVRTGEWTDTATQAASPVSEIADMTDL